MPITLLRPAMMLGLTLALMNNVAADTGAQTLYTTSITQAEILHGIMLLAPGRKRRA